MADSVLVTNISELVTFEPLTRSPYQALVTEEDLGIIKDAWFLVRNGKIEAFGEKDGWKSFASKNILRVNAEGSLVLPGLVDSHTHVLYGGDRSEEFSSRLEGKTYAEIASAGGGIYSSVKKTMEASEEELLNSARKRVENFLSHGVTSLEVKSGYSFSWQEDLRQLRLLNRLKQESLQTICVTALPLHVLPKEQSAKNYIKELVDYFLPVVSEEGLADFVDMFIEDGYYKASDCEPFLKKAKELGLGIKIHADEFTRGGGSKLAADWGAVSADHLQHASYEDKKALAEAQVVATLLPGTSLYAKIPYTQARGFLEAGCQLAVASDHNPGSCQLSNLPMLASLAALHCGLTAPEALAAVTFMGARALSLEAKKGALAKSYDADFLILPFHHYKVWLASFGEFKPKQVWVKGKRVI
jgi:imidazolonepropionase